MKHILIAALKQIIAKPKAKIEYEETYGGMVEDKRILKLIPKTDALRDYIFNNDKTLGGIVALSEGKPIGFATLHPTTIGGTDIPSTMYAMVEMIVSTKFRKQGIGETLIKKVIELGKDEDFEYFIGYTHHSPGFKRLSEKYGIIDNDDASRDLGWDNIEDNISPDDIKKDRDW